MQDPRCLPGSLNVPEDLDLLVVYALLEECFTPDFEALDLLKVPTETCNFPGSLKFLQGSPCLFCPDIEMPPYQMRLPDLPNLLELFKIDLILPGKFKPFFGS